MATTRPSLARLLRIHHCLAAGRHPTLGELAKLCGVHERTIKRDLGVLRDEFGAPLEYCRRRRGYTYREPFSLDSLPLAEGELLALCMTNVAADMFRNTPFAAALQRALDKLQVLLPAPIQASFGDGLYLSSVREPAPPERVESAIHFNDLVRAIRQQRQVRMRYFTMARNRESVRVVDPYHLYFHEGMWYLYGFCHSRRTVRDFAVERIQAVELLAATFTPPPAGEIRAELGKRFSLMDDAVAPIEVWFDAAEARRIKERVWHPTQEIADSPDGSCTLRMRVQGLTSVVRWVLSFGRHARPLSPPALVQAVRAEVRAMSAMSGR